MLKPWREIAVPNEEVRKGTFQQAEFAADLSRVHDGTAAPDYQNPRLFFERTYITEGMGLMLETVAKRLSGLGGDPVIQLQTAFGGGKTHSMLAVYHLANGDAPAAELAGLSPILDRAGVTEVPRARVVVLDGIMLGPNQPRVHGETKVRTLWGELAWQLGREEGYALVRDADESGTSPGQAVLVDLLQRYAPCVILVDELVAYVRQLEEGQSLAGGSFGANMTFVQAVTQALKAVPTAILLASLPLSAVEAGGSLGKTALHALEHYFERVQEIWKPVATEEAFEIVRRRLFQPTRDQAGADAVCDAFADFYLQNGGRLPSETQEARYVHRLRSAYPIHPEVFDRLYEDWSTLDNFQRTRGVLKMMAQVIHRLWKDDNKDYLIMPGNLPLYDPVVRTEAIKYLPQGWDPVIEGDIDGERAETTQIEMKEPYLGTPQACRRAARTVFLGSAPTSANLKAHGVDVQHVVLGCAQPGQAVGVYEDALKRLNDRLHYLNSGNDRYWFDTRANLRREMEDRKKRFDPREHVFPLIKKRLESALGPGMFGGVHVFTPAGDVPDDVQLRLIVLAPDAAHLKGAANPARDKAIEIVSMRGNQPRRRQNRLIFLAADNDTVGRLYDMTRSVLAWESILKDYSDHRLVLDNLIARTAEDSLKSARQTLDRMVRECYRWILAPSQEANGKTGGLGEVVWEALDLNTGAKDLAAEIRAKLKENEWVIEEWAPIHLRELARRWFWKDDAPDVAALDVWEKMACYVYLPRLKDEAVYKKAVQAGASSRDFFGLAYGREGERYTGFRLAEPSPLVVDGTLLLIHPETATLYETMLRTEKDNRPAEEGEAPPSDDLEKATTGKTTNNGHGQGGGVLPVIVKPVTVPRRQFYGEVSLDPYKAKLLLSDLVDEVLKHFTAQPGVDVSLTVEIRAKHPQGFEESMQRTVRENCATLKFKSHDFEPGE